MKNNKLLIGLAVGAMLYFVFKNKDADDTTRIGGESDDANALRQQLNNALADLDAKILELSESQSQVSVLEGQVTSKDAIIQGQITEIARLNGIIESLNDTDDPQIPTLTGTIFELNNQLDELIIRRNELEGELDNALNEIEAKEQALIIRQTTIDNLMADNTVHLADIDSLEAEIIIRNNDIADALDLNAILENEKEVLINDKLTLQDQINGLNINVTNLNDALDVKEVTITQKSQEITTLSNNISES